MAASANLSRPSYGDSPYQSFSTFAGNPYFIDLDLLASEGLLVKKNMYLLIGVMMCHELIMEDFMNNAIRF